MPCGARRTWRWGTKSSAASPVTTSAACFRDVRTWKSAGFRFAVRLPAGRIIGGMTDETSKAKRKHWRWIIGGVLSFLAVSVGFEIKARRQYQAEVAWLIAAGERNVQVGHLVTARHPIFGRYRFFNRHEFIQRLTHRRGVIAILGSDIQARRLLDELPPCPTPFQRVSTQNLSGDIMTSLRERYGADIVQ